jgi:DUF438 domain-containing protein
MPNPVPSWSDLLVADHETTERVFDAMQKVLHAPEPPSTQIVADALEYFSSYIEGCHAHKEEDHLFPLMEGRGLPPGDGPLAVMRAEHRQSDAALADFRRAAAAYTRGDGMALTALRDAFGRYAGVLREHFWKETDILFPMAHRLFEAADHESVLRGIEAVERAIGPDTRPRFLDLAQRILEESAIQDLSENLPPAVLAAVLNRLPVELSFVDADDCVRYFSHEGQAKVFPRTRGAIGRAVQQCHPPASVDRVNAVLRSLKSGARDVAEFWLDFRDRKIHVRYFAVRDAGGAYLGCLETVQDITDLQKITGERRLVNEALAG